MLKLILIAPICTTQLVYETWLQLKEKNAVTRNQRKEIVVFAMKIK
jgi:hypothetical protein